MLKINALTKSYGADPVFQDLSLVLNAGARAGLVGANGSGKSTLLQIIAGLMPPDSGSVWIDPSDRVAYVPQYPQDGLHRSVRDVLLTAWPAGLLRQQLESLERAMHRQQGEELARSLVTYGELRDAFERLGGYQLDARLDQIVQGLALDAGDLNMPVGALSGGNKTKVSLARMLLADATILLLDEPTNYLDLGALLWLERCIADHHGTFVIVSHDRRFLDHTVHSIIELDSVRHTARTWSGNYSAYAESRSREEQSRLEAYRDQQERIARIEEDIRRTRQQARGVETSTHNDQVRRYAKKVAAKAKARERRLERELSQTAIEKPTKGWNLHLVDLGRDPIDDQRTVLEMSALTVAYGGHQVLREIDLLVRGRDRVALLGENGSGKSTLLRCIIGKAEYSGLVRMGPSVRAGYLSQDSEELPHDLSVLEVFRNRTTMHEDEARSYLHRFLFTGQEVLRPIGSLSYGQRSKLALAMLILSDANLLLLDEPTSHMDMPALEAIEEALAGYRGPMVLVSHDRYFIERVGVNRVQVLRDGRLHHADSVAAYEAEMTRGVNLAV